MDSPGRRLSPEVHEDGQYSPGVESPASWRDESPARAPRTRERRPSRGKHEQEEEKSALQDVCGVGCFSCLFGKSKKKKGRRAAAHRPARDSPPQSPASPNQQEHLRLGIVIAHYTHPLDPSKKLHVVHGMSEEGAARRSRLVQEGDVIRAINHESVDYLDQDAVKTRFELAQSNSDHVFLGLQRNSDEIHCTIHLLATHYQLHHHAHSNSTSPSRHIAVHHGTGPAPIASFPWQAFGLPPGMGMVGMGQNMAIQERNDFGRGRRRREESSPAAGHWPPASPVQKPSPTRLLYPPSSPTMGESRPSCFPAGEAHMLTC
jgi:hypothetical protein